MLGLSVCLAPNPTTWMASHSAIQRSSKSWTDFKAYGLRLLLHVHIVSPYGKWGKKQPCFSLIQHVPWALPLQYRRGKALGKPELPLRGVKKSSCATGPLFMNRMEPWGHPSKSAVGKPTRKGHLSPQVYQKVQRSSSPRIMWEKRGQQGG